VWALIFNFYLNFFFPLGPSSGSLLCFLHDVGSQPWRGGKRESKWEKLFSRTGAVKFASSLLFGSNKCLRRSSVPSNKVFIGKLQNSLQLQHSDSLPPLPSPPSLPLPSFTNLAPVYPSAAWGIKQKNTHHLHLHLWMTWKPLFLNWLNCFPHGCCNIM